MMSTAHLRRQGVLPRRCLERRGNVGPQAVQQLKQVIAHLIGRQPDGSQTL